MNRSGKVLKDSGIQLLYHNHNSEFRKVEPGKTAYDMIIEETNPEYVNFELDSYWTYGSGCIGHNSYEKAGRADETLSYQ